MKIKINTGKCKGTIYAPPSKSVTHRALICAYLSRSRCKIDNVDFSDDINATLSGLSALGASVRRGSRSVTMDPGGSADGDLYCGESGSTLRFLIPLALDGTPHTLRGSKRLFSRSLSVYEKLFDERGIDFSKTEDSITVRGRLTAGTYRVRADVSSQFISGLAFVLPTLHGNSVIEFEGRAESFSYLNITRSVLKDFGVEIIPDDDKIIIPGDQRYIAPERFEIEGDWSNAAFFLALHAEVKGLDNNSAQGDRMIAQFLSEVFTGSPTLDVSDCPDLAPILMAMMAANNGGILTGTRRLRIKESDRGAVMAEELEKFGVKAEVKENEILIGHGLHHPSAVLNGHNDHRIVMSLAVLCTFTGGYIEGSHAINKSFPDFFRKLSSLGIEVMEVNDEA